MEIYKKKKMDCSKTGVREVGSLYVRRIVKYLCHTVMKITSKRNK